MQNADPITSKYLDHITFRHILSNNIDIIAECFEKDGYSFKNKIYQSDSGYHLKLYTLEPDAKAMAARQKADISADISK